MKVQERGQRHLAGVELVMNNCFNELLSNLSYYFSDEDDDIVVIAFFFFFFFFFTGYWRIFGNVEWKAVVIMMV